MIAHPDGAGAKFLTELSFTNNPMPTTGKRVTWSPDGKWIAFCRTAINPPGMIATDIWIMKRDGTEQQQVTKSGDGSSAYQPHWFMPE